MVGRMALDAEGQKAKRREERGGWIIRGERCGRREGEREKGRGRKGGKERGIIAGGRKKEGAEAEAVSLVNRFRLCGWDSY